MSNIRLNTIVPDIVGTINLPGSLNVTSLSSLSILDATTTSSASITTLGGIGITKSLAVGGNLDFRPLGSGSTISVVTDVGSDNKSLILSATGSTSYTRGASLELYGNQLNSGGIRLRTSASGSFIVQCGSNDLATFLAGKLTITGTTPSTSSTDATLVISGGGLSISNTTAATSYTSGGSLTVGGGLAVGGSVFIGGTISSLGGLTNSTFIQVSSTTDATAIGEGSFISLGGGSFSKNFWVGGTTNLASVNITGLITSTSTSDVSITTTGGLTVSKNISATGNISAVGNLSITGLVANLNATNSTLPTNGAMVVTGGLGIGLNVSVGGSISINNNVTLSGTSSVFSFAGTITGSSTTDSTSLTTGSIVTAGGVAIGKILRVGDNAIISGALSVNGTSTIGATSVSGILSITNATASTNATSGALVVTGGFGLSGALNIAGISNFLNVLDASSITTAAVVIAGGVGIAKALCIGTTLNVIGSSTLAGLSATTISASGILTSSNTTQSTTATNGAATFAGGIGIAMNANVGGNILISGTGSITGNLSSGGLVTFTNTTDSVSLSTASVVASGGISISKILRVGTDAFIGGNLTVTGTHVSLNTTVSTTSANGALVIAGGVGIGGALNVGGTLNSTGATILGSTLSVSGSLSITNTTDSSSISTGSLITSGGIAVTKQVRIGTDLTVIGITQIATVNVSGKVSITDTTEATNFSTASLTLAGGLGVSKRVYLNSTLTVASDLSIAGTVVCANITDSTTSANGSATFSGGVGISRNLNVGGGLSVGAASFFTGAIVNTTGSLTLNSVLLSDVSGMLQIVSSLPGMRIAATDASKLTQYANYIDLFAFGNSYVDANHESLQITTTSTNTFSIMSRSAGSGVLRRLVLQSGGSNTGQVILNTDGTIQLGISTGVDSSTPTNGSVTILGGLGISKSVSIKSTLRLFGSSSGAVIISSPSNVTSYNLTLPNSVAPSANFALVSDTSGNLTWSEMTTANPTFTTVSVSNTAAGSITTAGGVTAGSMILTNGTFGSNLPILTIRNTAGGGLNTVGIDILPYSGRSGGAPVRLLAVDATNTDAYFSLRVATGGSAITATETLRATTASILVQPGTTSTSTTSGALQVVGGVGIGGATFMGSNLNFSGGNGLNQIIMNTNGAVAPTTTTRSQGSRIVLYPMISASTSEYAIGIETSHMWFSVGDTSYGYKWYNNTTNTLTLRGVGTSGNLILNGGLRLQFGGATSGIVTLASPDTITSYTLTLPPSAPTANNYALVSTTSGVLSWAEMTTANPTFTTVSITGTTASTSVGSGSFINSGGMSVGNGLSIKGNIQIEGNTSGTVTLKVPDTNSSPTFIFPGTSPGSGQILSSDANGQLNWIDMGAPITFTASGNNNVSTPQMVNGMKYTGVFVVQVQVTVTKNTGRLDALYTLRGFPTSNGFALFPTYVGDDTGYTFTIDSTGQIYYTSTNIVGWTGATIRWIGSNIYTASPAGTIPTSISGANNVSTAADVSGLTITGTQFSIYVLVTVNATTSSTSLYLIEGAYQQNGVWYVTQHVTGPDRGIQFSITGAGQIQYTSPDIAGWLATYFQYYAPPTALVQRAAFLKLTVGNEGVLNSGYPFEVETNMAVGGTLSVNKLSLNPSVKFQNSTGTIDNVTFSSSTAANCVIQIRHSNRSEIWDCGPDSLGSFVVRQNNLGVYLGAGATSWASLSDRSLKKDVEELNPDNCLNQISEMSPIKYKMIDDKSEIEHYGLIAQEVTEILPELVSIGPNEKLGLNYTELIPILLSAVKGLNKKVAELEERLQVIE